MALSALEVEVRARDRKDLNLEDSARHVAKELGANPATCRAYLLAKRSGESCHRSYLYQNRTRKFWCDHSDENPAASSELDGYPFMETPVANNSLDAFGSMEFNPYKALEREELVGIVGQLVDDETLSERERYVLEQRFFKERTLRDLAKEIGVSFWEVALTEREALEKLRHVLAREGVNDFT
jgi:RNA polymerase sigma factor (sigma-70 family)